MSATSVLNRLRRQPRLPNGRFGPRPSQNQRRMDAEQRSLALLKALVDPKDWDGDTSDPIQPIRVETEQAIYSIRIGGMVENISFVFKNTTQYGNKGGRICGGPYLWSDYATPASSRRTRIPQIDDQLWAQAMGLEYGRQPLPIPIWDFYLGQYLGLKYNEVEFLRASVVAYTRY